MYLEKLILASLVKRPYGTLDLVSKVLVSKMESAPFKLQRITFPSPTKAKRQPRRNTRDPRLPSYRPPSPTRYQGRPLIIPLEYPPVLEAKPPVRKFGLERSTRVNNNTNLACSHFTSCFLRSKSALYKPLSLSLFISQASRAAPNMKWIIDSMAAIHAPAIHPQKTLIGAIVKGVRPSKGSINVPGRPRDPRQCPRALPPSPLTSDSDLFKGKTALNKSKIFYLSLSLIQRKRYSKI